MANRLSKSPEYTFDPDQEGKNINAVADLTVIGYSNEKNASVMRRVHLQEFGKDCTCPTCRQTFNDQLEDASDTADWVQGLRRWAKSIANRPKNPFRPIDDISYE